MGWLNDLGSFFGRIRSNRPGGGPGYSKSSSVGEMQLLLGHSDIVRHLLCLPAQRLASAGDDGRIIVWAVATGQQLASLCGHTRPISCLLLLEDVLLSGSSDNTIRMWDLFTYKCLRTLTAHTAGIQSLAVIPSFSMLSVLPSAFPHLVPASPTDGLDGIAAQHKGKRLSLSQDASVGAMANHFFCSGGNDQFLNVWDGLGNRVMCVEREDTAHVQKMLGLGDGRIVCTTTSSDPSEVLIYYLYSGRKDRCQGHRDTVTCLIHLPQSQFASASIDGIIIVWRALKGSPVQVHKILHYPHNYLDSHSGYLHPVTSLRALGRQFLGAAIGKSFYIYHVQSRRCIMRFENAHKCDVSALIPLYGGRQIVTCAEDHNIFVWEAANLGDFTQSRFLFSKKLELEKVHTLSGHMGGVTDLLRLSSTSFASCGRDGAVILWKDAETETLRRNAVAHAHRIQMFPQGENTYHVRPEYWRSNSEPALGRIRRATVGTDYGSQDKGSWKTRTWDGKSGTDSSKTNSRASRSSTNSRRSRRSENLILSNSSEWSLSKEMGSGSDAGTPPWLGGQSTPNIGSPNVPTTPTKVSHDPEESAERLPKSGVVPRVIHGQAGGGSPREQKQGQRQGQAQLRLTASAMDISRQMSDFSLNMTSNNEDGMCMLKSMQRLCSSCSTTFHLFRPL